MAITLSVDEATTLFIDIATKTGIDPAMLDRDKIRSPFVTVFNRRARENKPEPTPEQIAHRLAPDLDDMIRRGLF